MPLPTINVPNFAGISTPINTPNSGRHAATDSAAVALSNEDYLLLQALGAVGDAAWASGNGSLVALLKTLATAAQSTSPSPVIQSLTPKPVAVSQTDFVLGATGAAGDTLAGIIIQPTGTTVGSVIVKDGSTAIYTYPGGTVDASLRPIIVGFGCACATAWKITTPSNATVTAAGKFT